MVLRVARLTLVVTFVLYGLGFVIAMGAPGPGLLVSLVAGFGIILSALACVIIQVWGLFSRTRQKPAEKPEGR
jgi:hypothetical protein